MITFLIIFLIKRHISRRRDMELLNQTKHLIKLQRVIDDANEAKTVRYGPVFKPKFTVSDETWFDLFVKKGGE